MSKPLVVVIPHRLSKQEAIARLQGSMGQTRALLAGKVTSIEEVWDGDRMNFKVAALGQTVSGHVQMTDDEARVEVVLPWLLASIADKIRGRVAAHGTKLLEKK